jgi:predicted membrane metal-binding protein
MMTLLALGTFMAGLHARVWRICAVGAIVLLAVPGVGWLHKSAVLLVIATLVVIAAGAATWWVDQRRRRAA